MQQSLFTSLCFLNGGYKTLKLRKTGLVGDIKQTFLQVEIAEECEMFLVSFGLRI